MMAMPRRLSAGIIGLRRYRNGQASVGEAQGRLPAEPRSSGANRIHVARGRTAAVQAVAARAGRQLEAVRRRRDRPARSLRQPVFRAVARTPP